MRLLLAIVPLVATVSASIVSNRSCLVTNYLKISAAVSNCTNIALRDVYMPSNTTLDLTKLKSGSVVTFEGRTTFGFTNSSSFSPIILGGNHVTITAAPDSVIEGNGTLYWDGLGSNGGVPKPNTFITIKKMTNSSLISNLTIKNWPVHLFSIQSSSDLILQNLFLDNRDGEAPNNRSNGLAAAHNSDGFGVKESSNVAIKDSRVYNQDDCVAVTSGDRVVVTGLWCEGGHGLSIGSVGGKGNNNVTNILFTNSTITNSTNGPRIKSNFNTTGYIANITYSNILLDSISDYGIDIQQDYLNGGPNGTPSNGVKIENVLFQNVTGSVLEEGRNYYVLCGEGSCGGIRFEETRVVGGGEESFCNEPVRGCPS